MTAQTVRVCLFDMDGTLLDSHKAFDRTWSRWAQGNGVDYAEAAAAMHGSSRCGDHQEIRSDL
jgi:beta-phosphoglucomutase-like phosphatase (HAD superfamily)